MPSPEAASPVRAVVPPDEERSQFLSRSGHEMRNPLANIMALLEGIQDGLYGDLSVRMAEALGTVGENAQRLLDLLNAYLDAEKITAGSISLQTSTVELDLIAAQALEHHLAAANAKPCELLTAVRPRGVTGSGDAKRLSQLATELLGCVLGSIPSKGSVHLEMEADIPGGQLLFVAWGGPKGTARLSPGEAAPSPALLERIRKLRGIGVALAERVLGMHGAAGVSAYELPGHGVQLEARLPLAMTAAQSEPEPESHESGGAEPEEEFSPTLADPENAPGILLVDDEDVLRDITQDYLEGVGYRVTAAKNGKEALDALKSMQPDLVIMDVLMPVMDGIEALQALRAWPDSSLASTPVILMSGLSVPAERDRCLAAGANATLVKPFGIKQLETAMAEFLAPHDAAAA